MYICLDTYTHITYKPRWLVLAYLKIKLKIYKYVRLPTSKAYEGAEL